MPNIRRRRRRRIENNFPHTETCVCMRRRIRKGCVEASQLQYCTRKVYFLFDRLFPFASFLGFFGETHSSSLRRNRKGGERERKKKRRTEHEDFAPLTSTTFSRQRRRRGWSQKAPLKPTTNSDSDNQKWHEKRKKEKSRRNWTTNKHSLTHPHTYIFLKKRVRKKWRQLAKSVTFSFATPPIVCRLRPSKGGS